MQEVIDWICAHSQLASFLTPISWLVTLFVSLHVFKRNDISRQKEKIVSSVESFFKDLNNKFFAGETTSDEMDDYLTAKVSILELQLNNLHLKARCAFISSETLSSIRSKPIDLLESFKSGDNSKHSCVKALHELEFIVIEEMETTYTERYHSRAHEKLFIYVVRKYVIIFISAGAVFLLLDLCS